MSKKQKFLKGDPVFHVDVQEPGKDGKIVEVDKEAGEYKVEWYDGMTRSGWYKEKELTLV